MRLETLTANFLFISSRFQKNIYIPVKRIFHRSDLKLKFQRQSRPLRSVRRFVEYYLSYILWIYRVITGLFFFTQNTQYIEVLITLRIFRKIVVFDRPFLKFEVSEIGMQTPMIQTKQGNTRSAICRPFQVV